MKVLKNNWYMLCLFFKAAPAYATLHLLLVVLNTMIFTVFGGVIYTKYLVDSVENVLSSPTTAQNTIIAVILVTCVYYICVMICNTIKQGPVNHYLKRGAEIKVRTAMLQLVFDKSIQVDVLCYDTPSYYQDLLEACKESNNRAWSVYGTFVKFIDAVLGAIALLIIVISTDVMVLIFAVVMHVFSQCITIFKNKMDFKSYNDDLPHDRQMDYVNRVFFEKTYAKDLKLTNIHHVLLDKIHTAAQGKHKTIDHYEKQKTLFQASGQLIHVLIGDLLCLLYLSFQTLVRNVYSFGTMAAMWNSYKDLKNKFGAVVNVVQEIYQHSLYIDHFLHFIKYENTVRTGSKQLPKDDEALSFEFKDVTFSYDGIHPVLQNFNLTIHKNERLAIVGNNGAGKSTLVKLLLRLYDPQKGTIYLNGIDIKEYNIEDYRKCLIGVLPQNHQLFSATLAENIKMDIADSSENEVLLYALRDVGLEQKIISLPNALQVPYSKEFSEDGIVFSGGEKQKLGIARLLYQSKKCMILDEPTSALDPTAERELNEYLLKQTERRTVIIISHRLSTAKIADRIVYIENGVVKEYGSHDQLIKMNGAYAQMFAKQSAMYG